MDNTQQHQDVVARARASLISNLAYLDLCDVLDMTGMILPDGTTIDNRTPEKLLVETVKSTQAQRNDHPPMNKDIMVAIKMIPVDDFLHMARECAEIGRTAINHEESPGIDPDLLASLIHDDVCAHTSNQQTIREISPEFFPEFFED